jgi:hypothetical protein
MGAASQNRTPDTQLFRDVFNASPIGIAVENLEGSASLRKPCFLLNAGFQRRRIDERDSYLFGGHYPPQADGRGAARE